MRLLPLIFLLFFCSCEDTQKPKNLISKEKMAEVLVDFAIYEQAYTVNPNANLEITSRYVLKKNNIKATDFNSSYGYYLKKTGELEDILSAAQKIILEKDPKARKFIEKRLKENPQLPAFAK